MKKYVMGLNGNIGSGKSRTADVLVNHLCKRMSAQRISFAQPIKETAAAMIFVGAQAMSKLVPVHGSLATLDGVKKFMADPVNKPLIRSILQGWGGELMRAVSPGYTMSVAQQSMMDNRLYIVDDVRFQDEVDWIHSNNGIVVKMEGGEESSHQVENQNLMGIDYFGSTWNINNLMVSVDEWFMRRLGHIPVAEVVAVQALAQEAVGQQRSVPDIAQELIGKCGKLTSVERNVLLRIMDEWANG